MHNQLNPYPHETKWWDYYCGISSHGLKRRLDTGFPMRPEEVQIRTGQIKAILAARLIGALDEPKVADQLKREFTG